MLSSWFGLEPIPICSIDLALFSGWGQSPAPILGTWKLPANAENRVSFRGSRQRLVRLIP